MFREELPENCPGPNAFEPDHPILAYRFFDFPASEAGLDSYAKTGQADGSECDHYSVSCITTLDEVKNRKRWRTFRSMFVYTVRISKDDGFVDRAKNDHFNWWPTSRVTLATCLRSANNI